MKRTKIIAFSKNTRLRVTEILHLAVINYAAQHNYSKLGDALLDLAQQGAVSHGLIVESDAKEVNKSESEEPPTPAPHWTDYKTSPPAGVPEGEK